MFTYVPCLVIKVPFSEVYLSLYMCVSGRFICQFKFILNIKIKQVHAYRCDSR